MLRCLETTLAAFDRIGVARDAAGDRALTNAERCLRTLDGKSSPIAGDNDAHLRSVRTAMAADVALD